MSGSNLINSGNKTWNTSTQCKNTQNHACFCHCLILIQSEVTKYIKIKEVSQGTQSALCKVTPKRF